MSSFFIYFTGAATSHSQCLCCLLAIRGETAKFSILDEKKTKFRVLDEIWTKTRNFDEILNAIVDFGQAKK